MTGPVTVSSGTLLLNFANVGVPQGFANAQSITINGGASLVANTNNSLYGFPTQGHTISINQGGLLTSPNNTTTHLNAVQIGGGTIQAAAVNVDGSWALDGGVSTPGGGSTSYILGGNLCLSQSTGGGSPSGTQFSVAFGDTLYVGSQITLCTGLASAVQFSLVNTGEGTLILAASNNFTASTQMNGGGTLVLANPAALSASQQLIINSGMVDFSAITSVFPLMGFGGNGGSLVLANTNGSPVNVSVGGGNGTTTYSGLLTGSGSLTLTGGHLTLSGFNNSYNATNLNGGVLTLGSPSANGTGAITFSGGTLQYTSAASGISDLSPQFNTTATSQKFNIDTGGLNVSYSGSLTAQRGPHQIRPRGVDPHRVQQLHRRHQYHRRPVGVCQLDRKPRDTFN